MFFPESSQSNPRIVGEGFLVPTCQYQVMDLEFGMMYFVPRPTTSCLKLQNLRCIVGYVYSWYSYVFVNLIEAASKMEQRWDNMLLNGVS